MTEEVMDSKVREIRFSADHGNAKARCDLGESMRKIKGQQELEQDTAQQ